MEDEKLNIKKQVGDKKKFSTNSLMLVLILFFLVIAGFVTSSFADGPDNATIGKITWAASRDSNWEIYIMNEDGTMPTRLTFEPPGGPADQHPVFTPDGSKIVWTRSPDFSGATGNNIWIMNPDGTGKTQLTFTGLDNHPFVANVSGIGIKIYFNRIAANGARLIMSMNMDGSGVTQLTDNTKSRWHPIVRESDGLIVYAVDADFDRIGEYAATFNQTSGVETIIYNPGWKVSAPAWKPDGSKIVLAEDHDSNLKYRIVTINPDGTGHTVLTDGTLHDTTPYYRYPTGDKIVFNRDAPDPSHRDVFIMNEDGTNQTNLTVGQPGGAESADTFVVEQGSCGPVPPEHPPPLYPLIPFVSNRNVTAGMPNYDIYVMTPDGTGITRLTTHPAIDNHPHFSPDGSKIVWSSDRAGEFDIYIANVSDLLAYGDSPLTVKRLTNDSYPHGPPRSYPDRHPGSPLAVPDGLMIVFSSKNRPNVTITEITTECSVPAIKTVVRYYEGMNIIKTDAAGNLIAYKELNITEAWNYTTYPDIWRYDNATYASHPSFRPDGSKIVFSAAIDGEGSIWEVYVVGFNASTMELVPNSLRRVTNGTLYPPNPNPIKMSGGAHFTPDGSKIVFSSTRTTGGNSQLFWAYADQIDQPVNESKRLTRHFANDYVPEPLPDGRIVFVSDRGLINTLCDLPPGIPGPTPDLDVFIMNPDGTGQTNLTDNDAADETLLIADEVSWFCGLKPNLATCTYYPRKMNVEALWLMSYGLVPTDALIHFNIPDAKHLYSIYWQNLESYMYSKSEEWPGFWDLWNNITTIYIPYLNETFPGLENQTLLDEWLEYTSRIREMQYVFPSIMFKEGIGTVISKAYVSPPEIIDLYGISETFTINITVHNVTDLYAWQAGMTFNPNVLEAISVEEGPFLATGGFTIWLAPTINNTTGEISPFGSSLLGIEVPGVSGSGTLAYVTFHIKGYGISTSHLTDVMLWNSTFGEIPVAVADGYFELSPPPAKFSLVTLYEVHLDVDYWFDTGANLTVMFYTYSGIYEANTTVWTGTTPVHVMLSMNVSHPLGLPVEMVTLVLTDSLGNILQTVTTFVVRRSDLMDRLTTLDILWALGYPKPPIFQEIVDIDMQWPYAPP